MLDLENGITVLSLFDGMCCGMIALQRAGIKVKAYYASEIDKPAMKVAKHNWPDIIHIGDVTKVHYAEGWLFTENGEFYVGKIDLLIGGSPCQDLRPGKEGLKGTKSKLFYEYYRILKETDPEYFLLENTNKVMPEDKLIIDELLKVSSRPINSSIFSAQSRKRLYWTNIPQFPLPADKNIFLKDITLNGENYCVRWQNSKTGPVIDTKSPTVQACQIRGGVRARPLIVTENLNLTPDELNRAAIKYRGKIWKSGNRMGTMAFPDRVDKKSKTLCATLIKAARETIHIQEGGNVRVLHPIECERLQTVPDNYTEGVSLSQRYRMLGNGWNVDTIVHLVEPIKYVI